MNLFLIVGLLAVAALLALAVYRAHQRGKERSRHLRRACEESEQEMRMSDARWSRTFGNWKKAKRIGK